MAIVALVTRVLSRQVGVLRWTLRVGITLLVVIVAKELMSSHPDMDRTLGYLFLGGGALYTLWRGIRALEGSAQRRIREAAKAAFKKDPRLSRPASRGDAIPFLIGSDLGRISLYPWAKRLEILLDHLLERILSCAAPELLWHTIMRRLLVLLARARGHWSRGVAAGVEALRLPAHMPEMGDEDVLQYLLVDVVLISALFRLHLAKWGLPSPPFTRESLRQLRREWIPFCLIEPTPNIFPPPLPDKLWEALKEEFNLERDLGIHEGLVSWIFRNDQTALSNLVRTIATQTFPSKSSIECLNGNYEAT
jgi:hypothetical protein